MDGFNGSTRFTEKAQQAISRAQQIMLELDHTQLDVEHVLLALLSEPDSLAVRILQRLRVNPDFVKSRVNRPGAEDEPSRWDDADWPDLPDAAEQGAVRGGVGRGHANAR